MSGDTSDSSSYFDGREPDELIRALVQKWPGTDGKITVGLHFLDLESNEVFIKAMPPDAPFCSTAVACGDHVYVIGGIRQNDATLFDNDGVNDVFQLDLKDLERGWRKTTSMLFPRVLPRVVAAEGKIFVFEYMGSESFGEVYDISGDIWEPLSPPPEDIDLCVPVLDSSRSRILVHCNANDTLYAYYYDRKSWVCLEQKFCYWSDAATIVDDVLYTAIYNYYDKFRSLEAYNLLDKKHLPVKWSSEFSVDPHGTLYRLGNGKCIFVWFNRLDKSFEYIRFHIWCNEQGGIHAAAEHQSAISVPYPKDISDIKLF
ncbi:hypothetical protein E1A91_D06G043100v1 [Gossypium mustelinum]|uniref:F-box associated domain-containing protein n=4 Tax=Gossypium TaxID=3633 RepID=A0A0D2R1P1_GOSRA|nr:putative F-box/kelch-repeat protein At4g34170 [Gossypium raimondii]KAB2023765.1 hypothetical protein ES319_D06G041300v1 [Gossypium barbadense]TYG63616.1 hypothetical protein ES288_D06G044200v1 [Gossypium darwinii]TYI75954.1 hypothetical protein E1A91_D06G043100v1 [Gossypium mustelinum]KJB64247.1 hypothetical protein B456_010G041400 [Gossypium raimondii]PPD96290.1 hypothetical protein GOBAR_DD06694 [Gossypium barbadense]